MDLSKNYLKIEWDIVDVSAGTSDQPVISKGHASEVSNADGYFGTNPTMHISFLHHTHSSIGLMFANHNISECTIYWYGENNEIIASGDFVLTASYSINKRVKNYKSITIIITRIRDANSTVTYPIVTYGFKRYPFGINVITQGNLLENFDPISSQLPINQFTFSMIDPDDEFNLGNPLGLHQFVQEGQTINPIEVIYLEQKNLGFYYVDTFSVENNLAKFTCVDLIGMLDKAQYIDGKVYDYASQVYQRDAGHLIEDIFDKCLVMPYSTLIDSDLYSVELSGALKPMSGRQALREVLFACGAVCYPYRGNTQGTVVITRVDRTIKSTITKSEKISTKVSKKEYVNSVEVSYTEYKLQSESKEISTETYDLGKHIIMFNSPYAEVTIDVNQQTAEITTRNDFYIVLWVYVSSAQITISGKGYDTITKSSLVERANSSSQKTNSLKYSSDLATAALANYIGNNILEYMALQLQVDTQYISDTDINLGDFLVIENPNEELDNYVAGVETLNIDLSGGFVTTAKLVGFFNYAFAFYRAGNELYTNDNIII